MKSSFNQPWGVAIVVGLILISNFMQKNGYCHLEAVWKSKILERLVILLNALRNSAFTTSVKKKLFTFSSVLWRYENGSSNRVIVFIKFLATFREQVFRLPGEVEIVLHVAVSIFFITHIGPRFISNIKGLGQSFLMVNVFGGFYSLMKNFSVKFSVILENGVV